MNSRYAQASTTDIRKIISPHVKIGVESQDPMVGKRPGHHEDHMIVMKNLWMIYCNGDATGY